MKKLTAFVLSIISATSMIGCSTHSTSIGIIGGADGPTAVFVTSRIPWRAICCFGGLGVVAALVVLLIDRKKK